MAKVFLICGKVCSGKTEYSHRLCKDVDAHLLSVDEITLSDCKDQWNTDHDDYVKMVKQILLDRSLQLIAEGKSIVFDWGFWSKREREAVKEFFKSRSIDFELHYINVSDDLWNKRIESRNSLVLSKHSGSYFVDSGLKEKCLALFEEPCKDEVDLIIYND